MKMVQKKESRVRVTHSGYKAVANPLKEDLQAWLDAGWVQEVDQPKEEGKSK